MATGDQFISITENRILGYESFKDYLFEYLREDIHTTIGRIFNKDGTFETISLAADGNDKFKLTWSETGVNVVDGDGYWLRLDSRATDVEGIQFENANTIDYEVGVQKADIPNGLFINSFDGLPTWDTMEEIVGYSGTPDAVVDGGSGTLVFTVDTITESGVSNVGRQVYVWKRQAGKAALAESDALELLTVAYTGGNNKITTVGNFGQGSSPSLTAADYVVVLRGPRVLRNTSLKNDASSCYIGDVTGVGVGSPPSSFDITEQNEFDIPLSDLSDIVRYENASGTDRLKVDVQAYSGESGDDQIRVTGSDTFTKFSVIESGHAGVGGPATGSYYFRVYGGSSLIDGALRVTGLTTLDDASPDTDDANDFGHEDYQWDKAYINNIFLDSHNAPSADRYHWKITAENSRLEFYAVSDDYASESRFLYFDRTTGTDVISGNFTSIDSCSFDHINCITFKVDDAAGNGVSDHFVPTATGKNLGNSTYYWNDVYADTYYGKTTTIQSFDSYDDLALVKDYKPSGKYEEKRIKGENRKIQLGDPGTLPWPMLDESGKFLDYKSSFLFLLGAIGQLYDKLKDQSDMIKSLNPIGLNKKVQGERV